ERNSLWLSEAQRVSAAYPGSATTQRAARKPERHDAVRLATDNPDAKCESRRVEVGERRRRDTQGQLRLSGGLRRGVQYGAQRTGYRPRGYDLCQALADRGSGAKRQPHQAYRGLLQLPTAVHHAAWTSSDTAL